MTHDRAGSAQFPLTQQFLAFMLGVQRPSVTPVAGALQRAGFIQYERGIVVIGARQGLLRASCECYEAIGKGFGEFRPAPEV